MLVPALQEAIAGDIEAARRRYQRALRSITRRWAEIPRERRPELERDVAFIRTALERLDEPSHDGLQFVSKSMSANLALTMRARDRRRS